MILVDAGPLIAMLVRSDRDHALCMSTLTKLRPPMVTTWPVIAEAMHYLARFGWRAQDQLWELVQRGETLIVDPDDAAVSRCRQLMSKYRDTPMDLADATLVAIAEQRKLKRIFTLDSHFAVYRLNDRTPFEVLP